MPNDNTIRDTAEAVKGIVEAVPIYEDALQPAARELGIALQTVAKTVHIALAPVSALVWGYDQIKDFVSTSVAGKLEGTPPESIITPPPNVAGPALESLRFTGHEECLRDMYANLLAAAMDRETARGAHPAFVEIIRQLTPDEAKLLGLIAQPRPLPLLDVRAEYRVQSDEHRGGYDLLRNFSTLGDEAGCEFPELTPSYIDNLCRVGLFEIPTFFEYTDPGVYDHLESHPSVLLLKEQYQGNEENDVQLSRKGLRVTHLGQQFCDVCVLDHQLLRSSNTPAGGS